MIKETTETQTIKRNTYRILPLRSISCIYTRLAKITRFSISYQKPSVQRNFTMGKGGRLIRVHVMEARSLRASDLTGWSDPFCTVHINKKRILKTDYQSRTLNPKWNACETFRYKGDMNGFFRVEIFDHDSVGGNDSLGLIEIAVDDPQLIQGRWTDHWYHLENHDGLPLRGYVRVRLQVKDSEDPKDFFGQEDYYEHPGTTAAKERSRARDEIQRKALRDFLAEQEIGRAHV